MPKDLFYKYILAAIFLGVLFFLKPVILLFIFLFFGFKIFLLMLEPSDRNILTKMAILALFLRLLFTAAAIFVLPFFDGYYEGTILEGIIGHSAQLFRDFHREILNGERLADYLLGKYGDVPLKVVAHSGATNFLNFGAYSRAFLNIVFGNSMLNIFVFPVISVFAVVIVYYLAKEIFNKDVAILSSLFLAVTPSFIIWSCINMRTTIGIISILIIGFSLAKLSKANILKCVVYFAVGIVLTLLCKDKFYKPLLAILPVAVFLRLGFNLRKKISLLILFSIIFVFAASKITFLQDEMRSLAIDLVSRQKGFATYEHGSNYKIYDDYLYSTDANEISRIPPLVFARALPKGIVYFMFAPFPWNVNNQLRLYSYPQIILWYFLFPFSVLGILVGLRYNASKVFALSAYVIFWVVMLSMTMGNEGIAARQRDLVLPFFYIFASCGIMKCLGRKVFCNI